MAFQSTVFINQASGVPGDKAADSPSRAQEFILQSVDPVNNIIGSTCYTVKDQGIAQAGSAGVYGFAGLLVNSKVYASFGTAAGGSLAPTMVLANEIQAELSTMGHYFVNLPAIANIGDLVVYNNTTGQISTIAPAAALPAGTSFAFAKVDLFNVASPGLAVIELSPTFVIPVP